MKVETVKTDQGKAKVPVCIKKSKRSGKEAAKKIMKKYDKIRREKAHERLVDTCEKRKKQRKIEIVDEIKNAAAKKNTRIVAKKVLDKYKRMKRPKKTYLVDEEDIETLDYDEPVEDLFKGESILEAVNKVFDFEKFKKEQAEAIDEMKKKNWWRTFLKRKCFGSCKQIFDFDKFKKQQEDAIEDFKQ